MVISDDQLKQLILQKGLAIPKELDEIVELAKNANIPLDEAIVQKDVISDANLGKLISEYLKIPFVELTKVSIPENVLNIVPEKIAKRFKVIPFMRDQAGLKIAMLDPTNIEIQEILAKKIDDRIIPYYATESDIYNILYIYRKDLQKVFDSLTREESTNPNIVDANEDAPIAKIVDLLISYAYQDKASDIHIEPEEKKSHVRFRIDGMLHDVISIPKSYHDRIINRIKVLSKLRTDEHLSPQDGKIGMKFEDDTLDLRVSIIPIVDGEKAVLRLLSSHHRQYSLLDLGMSDSDLKKVTSAFNKPYGMILSTGPTGSGKSTAIYAILKILNSREKNITTIEDPVEYRVNGINQIQVNTKTNLTFASGLRSILRQDPNIIFVGEIRDSETASIAVNAALTGHLVLSTLHTNDAATALPRLIDMKVEPFLVASTINIIIAQRLIRRICDMCRISFAISLEILAKQIPVEIIKRNFGASDPITVYKGKGCRICHNTGYNGRIGIFEILDVSPQIKKQIVEKNDSDIITQTAISEGMTTMLDDGLQKVAKGITTIEEVLRATTAE